MKNNIEHFIADLYPFYIKIGKDCSISSYGKSLHKIVPDILNQYFQEHFVFIRPSVGDFNFNELKKYQQQLIIIQSTDCADLTFRGELKYEASENVLYFLGSPWVLNAATLKNTGLTIADFSPSDSMTDILGISEQYSVTLQDTFDLVNQLRVKSEKTNKIFNSLAEIIFQTDNEGRWTFLNKAWEKTMGFTVGESINTLFFNYLHPDDVQRNWDLFLPLINREKSYCNHQIRYITKDEKIKWIRVYATLIIDENNETQGTAGTLLDITKEIENERQLELILNNIRDEISLVDINTYKYVFVSPSVIANRGFDSLEDFLQYTTQDTLHPDDFIKALKILNSGQTNIDGEFRFKMKNGDYKWYNASCKQITDVTTDKKYLLIVSSNIEEKKKSEQHLSLITNNISDEITMFDFDGNYLYATPSVFKNRGYESFKDLKSIDAFSIVTEEEKIAIISNLKEFGEHKMERRFKKPNGEYTWYDSTAKLINDELNNKQYILAVARNIDERKNAEKHTKLITNNISDEITMFDLCGNYTYASKSVLVNRGYKDFDEIKKVNAFSKVSQEDFEMGYKSLTIDGEFRVEHKLTNNYGETLWYESFLKLIKDELSGKDYVIAVARNIENRKKAQLQTELALQKEKEVNKLKTEFITTSSHEFKTPLAIIKNNIEILQSSTEKELKGETKVLHTKFLDRIDSETNRMLQLINDTLILEKANINILSTKKKKINLFFTIASVIERFNLLQKDGRTVFINTINKPKDVYADKDLIDHVFQNLISNAFKYSLGKKQPEITLEFKKDFAEVIIQDYGIGIPEKDMDKLFIPFNRASNTQGIAGSGMGLSIVKKILDLHEATIHLSSRLNVGTIVKIEFPYLAY